MKHLNYLLGCLMVTLLGCDDSREKEKQIQELEAKVKALEEGKAPAPAPIHWLNAWVDSITEELIFRTIGLACIALGALALPVAVVLLFLGLRWLAKVLASCGPIVAAVGIVLVWVAHNITWVQVVILVPAAALGAWLVWSKLVPRIERIANLDLNRNKDIGT